MLAQDLLSWYDVCQRRLPWRGTRDPYRIWLSEIMLQQTRAETVEGYYARFLERFPSVGTLADAEQDEVLKLWEGLGYYARARNLHSAAKIVAYDLDGRFPETAEGLRSLPGIGRYAANAIASIAYGEAVPALDGNQARVLARILSWDAPLKTPFDLNDSATLLISREHPGDYNQALMDLGALICLPKRPKCGVCPIARDCTALKGGDPEAFPLKMPPIERREEALTVLLIQSPKGFCLRRRSNKGLLGGLYEFPTLEGHPTRAQILAQLAQAGFANPTWVRALPPAKHVFTHLVWKMRGALLTAESAPEGCFWCSDLNALAIPSALRVYREIAEAQLHSL